MREGPIDLGAAEGFAEGVPVWCDLPEHEGAVVVCRLGTVLHAVEAGAAINSAR